MTLALGDGAARELVSSTGLDRTLFVDAGAGSGKTSQLVERIANLVLGGVDIEHIAAITFTEAAAAELQARIRARLQREPTAASAVAALDRAAISTLHAFAYRLLGEFAVDANLPPRVRVLDEVSSQLARESRWRRFVDDLHAEADADAAVAELLVRAELLDIVLEPRWSGQPTLADVARLFDQHWDRLDPLLHAPVAPLRPLDFRRFDDAVGALQQVLGQCRTPADKLYDKLCSLHEVLRRVVAIDEPAFKLRAIAIGGGERKGWSEHRSVGQKANWAIPIEQVREIVAEVNTARSELYDGVVREVLHHLRVRIAGEVRAAAEQRRAAGALEFHDLLVLARDLLRRSPSARQQLHERYTHLLLDEFQDTDPLQVELATLIAGTTGDGVCDRAWAELEVEPGRLFFVGDPKQSIYRFRRADIELFMNARAQFGGEHGSVSLSTNFRTVRPILDAVNAMFAGLMPRDIPGRQPRYEPLAPFRDGAPTADHRPVVLGGVHPDPKVRADLLREVEAADVAAVIDHIRLHPGEWPVEDRAGGGWRPARLPDVTVLVPTRTSVTYLRAALDARSIPYRLATGSLVYDTQEVRDALAALRAVDDPTDERSLVAALRSPLYGCSDVDLFTFRQAHGAWDIRSRPTGLAEDHPVIAALEHLTSLWEDRWWASPSALLDRLLRERGAQLLALAERRPAEVWRRLRFLLEGARSFEEAGGAGLRAYLAWTDLQGADGARAHEPLLPETDDDGISILTVHGAKGLEFPITVLSGMTTKPGGQRSGPSVLWGEDGVPEIGVRKGVQTEHHEPRADLESEMDAHEKRRLLYVAMTRARDHLVISGHHKADTRPGATPDTYAAVVAGFATDHPELFRPLPELPELPEASAVARPAVLDGVQPEDDDREGWISTRAALLAPHRAGRVRSATAIARDALSMSADPEADSETADRELDDSSPTPYRRGRAGTAIGRAVHAVLQFLDLPPYAGPTAATAADLAVLDGHVRRQCELEAIPEHHDTVAAMVRSALRSHAVTLAARWPHHKELYVAAPVGDHLVEGYVDLLVETAEGLVVVDYKTDTVRSDADVDRKLDSYELQAATYAEALEIATGLPVIECRFVFCRPSGAIERAVRDLPGARGRVRDVLARPAGQAPT